MYPFELKGPMSPMYVYENEMYIVLTLCLENVIREHDRQQLRKHFCA